MHNFYCYIITLFLLVHQQRSIFMSSKVFLLYQQNPSKDGIYKESVCNVTSKKYISSALNMHVYASSVPLVYIGLVMKFDKGVCM